MAVARGLALFIGGFSLLNLLGELRHAGFDATVWWIDLRPLGPALSRSLLFLSSLLLIGYGVQPPRCRWRRAVTGAAVSVLLAIAAANALDVWMLTARDVIATGCPITFSVLIAVALAWILTGLRIECSRAQPTRRAKIVILGLTVATCMVGFPLAQMYCFGMTDYRRAADAVVIFGARVYADGRVSDALADRVRTGCSLYHEGLARKVMLSGGPGDGTVHETEGMRRMAMRLGVPAQDILIDEQGLNTQATVRNTCEVFEEHGLHRVLAVSHFYHLPRIKLTYQRHGREVYTVPARETHRLTALPIYIMREVAALWVYYARPLCR